MAAPIILIPSRHDLAGMHQLLPMQGMGQPYLSAILAAGGVPLMLALGADEDAMYRALHVADGLLLAGGEDVDPALFGEEPHAKLGTVDLERDEAELTLTRHAIHDSLPVFAICRGIQVLNVAMGGTLYQDIPSQLPGALKHDCSYPAYPRDHIAHTVQAEAGSRLAEIIGTAPVETNSLHHQAIKDLGDGLRVVARAPDGVVEGVQGTGDGWLLAVQWHPEELRSSRPDMARLFEAFIEAAGR